MAIIIVSTLGKLSGTIHESLSLIGGKPALQWSLEAILNANRAHRTYLVTKDTKEATLATEFAAKTFYIEDNGIIGSLNSSQIVFQVINRLDIIGDPVITLISPENPFITSDDIDNTIEMIEVSNAESVIGVTRTNKTISDYQRLDQVGHLVPFSPSQLENSTYKKYPLYQINGAIFSSKLTALKHHGSFLTPAAFAYVLSTRSSFTVLTEEDLELANRLV